MTGFPIDFFDLTTLAGSVQSQDPIAVLKWLEAHPGSMAINEPISKAAGDTLLYMAVLLKNIDIVRILLAHGADPTRQDEDGQTVLHYAFQKSADQKTHDIIIAIAETREVLKVADMRGYTPLHLAVCAGYLDLVDRFIQLGADISAKTKNGESIVFLALRHDRREIAQLLINKGAEIDFFALCLSGIQTAVSDLLGKQPSLVSSRLRDGTSPLHLAAFRGDAALVRILLDHGADMAAVDEDQETALFKTRDPRTAQALIDAGANANAQNTDGETPLFRASSASMVATLLDGGADISHRDLLGWTALHSAEDAQVVTGLLNGGAPVDARNNEEETPLRYAICNYKDTRIMRALLSHGADPSPLFEKIGPRGHEYHCYDYNEIESLLSEAGYLEHEIQVMFSKHGWRRPVTTG